MVLLEGKAIADTILGVAASIFKYKDETNKIRADRRDRVADYFLEISKTIEEAANYIARGEHPHGACESLRTYAGRLPDTIRDFVPEPEAKEYGDKLMTAYSLEHIACNASAEERNQIVIELRSASGIFRALGYDMRAHQ
jgi:hypothetical protein